jgi:hypothetical protein
MNWKGYKESGRGPILRYYPSIVPVKNILLAAQIELTSLSRKGSASKILSVPLRDIKYSFQ